MAPRKILVPIDSSANSQRAFDYYLENIAKPDDTVLLCHVNIPPHLPTMSFKEGFKFPADEWAQKIQEQVKETNKLMEHYEMICEEKQITKRPIVSEGKPGEAIVEAAKKENVSLIVMGSRGLNTLRRTFMGSVSDYVLHHVHVPVMIVPPAHE